MKILICQSCNEEYIHIPRYEYKNKLSLIRLLQKAIYELMHDELNCCKDEETLQITEYIKKCNRDCKSSSKLEEDFKKQVKEKNPEIIPCKKCGTDRYHFNVGYDFVSMICDSCYDHYHGADEKKAIEEWNKNNIKMKKVFPNGIELIECPESIYEKVCEVLGDIELPIEKKISTLPCKQCGKIPKIEKSLLLSSPPKEVFELHCYCFLNKYFLGIKEQCIKEWNSDQFTPKYLSFEEALKLVREGKKVRNDKWVSSSYMDKDGIFSTNPSFIDYNSNENYPKDATTKLLSMIKFSELISNKWLEVKE